jgi:hypothetical protein
LSERDVNIVDSDSDRRRCWLFGMGSVVRKPIESILGVGEVELKYLCKG